MMLSERGLKQMTKESRQYNGDGAGIVHEALYELAFGMAARRGMDVVDAAEVADAAVRLRQILRAAQTVVEGVT